MPKLYADGIHFESGVIKASNHMVRENMDNIYELNSCLFPVVFSHSISSLLTPVLFVFVQSFYVREVSYRCGRRVVRRLDITFPIHVDEECPTQSESDRIGG
jgi:hypothetical protein